MKSALPKVLQPIAGRPMLAHVIAAARALAAGRHPRGATATAANRCARPSPTSPTCSGPSRRSSSAPATRCSRRCPTCPTARSVLVLYGDVPLITPQTLRGCSMRPARLAVLAAELADPTGYGRIVRDAEGRVAAIVEHKDADDDAAPDPPGQHRRDRRRSRRRCKRWLGALRNDNAQGEYYLTDVFRDGRGASSAPPRSCWSPTRSRPRAPTIRWQLAQLERAFQLRAARALCVRGRALRRSGALRRARRRSRSGAMSRSTSTWSSKAASCSATACASARSAACGTSRSRAGTEVRAHCDLDGARTEGAVHDRPVRAPAAGHRARRRRARRQLRRDQEREARRRQQGQPPHLPRRRGRSARASTSAPAPSPATTTA